MVFSEYNTKYNFISSTYILKPLKFSALSAFMEKHKIISEKTTFKFGGKHVSSLSQSLSEFKPDSLPFDYMKLDVCDGGEPKRRRNYKILLYRPKRCFGAWKMEDSDNGWISSEKSLKLISSSELGEKLMTLKVERCFNTRSCVNMRSDCKVTQKAIMIIKRGIYLWNLVTDGKISGG